MKASVVRLPTHGGAEEHKGPDRTGSKQGGVALVRSPEQDEDRRGKQEKNGVEHISGEYFGTRSARNIECIEFARVSLLDH